MDRCALFVDAGYLLADGAMAVHGTRHREAVSWDYPGLLQFLTKLSRERTGLPLLRCYWYEATVEGRRTPEHDVLADIPGLKLRLGRIRPGRREGVDAQVHRDLMTLARNNAVCDAVVVSGDEDLTQVVSDAQDLGIRVTVMQIAVDGAWSARTLRQECDDLVEIASGHLRPYVAMVTGGVPSLGTGNGQANGNGLVAHTNGALPNGALPNGVPSGTHVSGSPSYGPQAQGSHATGAHGTGAHAAGALTSGSHGGTTPAMGSNSTAQHGTPPHGAPPHVTVQHDASQHGTAQHGTAQHGTAQHGAGVHGAGVHGAGAHDSDANGAGAHGAETPAMGAHGTGTHAAHEAGTHGARTHGTASHAQPNADGTPGGGAHSTGTHSTGTHGTGAHSTGAHGTGTHGTGAHSGARSSAAHARPALPAQPSPPLYGHPPEPAQQQRPAQPPATAPLSAPPASPTSPASNASTPPSPHGATQPPPSTPGQSPYASGPAGGGYSPSQLGPYTGPQPAPVPVQSGGTTTLAEAVQAAHKEGHDFGESVARDAPALWLEAVLARKPRMPSDLEARLLQGSSLPIDYLLHDEVRHALRRGFWDALERARR